MENEKDLLRIYNYLSGEMDRGDRELFERNLNGNPELELLFKEIEGSWVAIEKEFVDREILDDFPNPNSRRILAFNLKYLSIAAGIIILILAGVYYWGHFSSPSLYDLEFKAHPGIRVIMGDSKNDLAEAMSLYRSGEYSESKSYFQKLDKDFPENDTVSFFLGNIALIEKEFSSASYYLHLVVVGDDSSFIEYSNWYLALVDVGQENWEGARSSLSEIVASGSKFSERAESLLLSISSK